MLGVNKRSNFKNLKMMKKCITCEAEKEEKEFNTKQSKCKDCEKLYTKKYNQENWKRTIVKSSHQTDLQKWNADEMEDFGEYITKERVSDLFIIQKGECFYECGAGKMELNCDRKKNPNAVTIERIDNNVPHVAENCVLVHHRCNMIRNDGASFDFMMKNAKVLRQQFNKRKFVKVCKTCLHPCKKINCGSHYDDKNRTMRMSYPTIGLINFKAVVPQP
jgi:hypothetical protein